MKVEKTKIDYIKGILFPLLTLLLLTVFLFNSGLTSLLFKKQDFSGYSPESILFLQIISGLCTIFLFLGGERTLKSFKKDQFDIQTIPFIKGIRNRDLYAVFIQYPLTLLFEELLFRGIFYALLSNITPIIFIVLINASVFGLYHIHIYITSKNVRISSIFIIFSFLLAVPLGLVFLYYGVIGCWIFHLISVTYIYLRWNSIKFK
ncbi:hypothetical protein NEF87_001002 [Candidatus Lokiarchaeum ossiferum]|uniref:CAAX prenyl protease 2/Lysostaphin resistance protein A-like domain-containing protein n=1 Tax=Candidatus Lokiarchaeum ossiferum TaxID=2951803 RepID=A0ABY6HMI8_9ARCH|nr:hypothetical protein NEF87_001002 [Candidatus Lokiarchaeum sp. B-35]